ncbi:MAG: putative peptide zinc metalloprotease protein [Actinomycetota bacterium]|nr:putative peptide zinc metalloprotease protein [Actinomycetota bacterium]
MEGNPPEEQKLRVRDVEKLNEALDSDAPPSESEPPPPPPPQPADDAATQQVEATTADEPALQLAEGVELLGEYEGSGFKEPRYNVRRPGGEMAQLTELLYLIAEALDGQRTYDDIAQQVSEKAGRKVTADNVKTLVEKNLIPDGFIAGHEADTSEPKADPLLALKFKLTLLPEKAVNFVAALLRPLFWPPLILAALVGFGILDVWYFASHGIAQSLRDLIYQPLIVLMIYGLLIVSVLWHELGHATATRYGGARPGRIGFGIYLVWPAFFTDVTDALKLGKGGRVRTDLGGIYFNILFSLAVGGAYALTGFEPILVLILMQHLMILYNLMPFLRLDGYHAISDLTGIPDLFGRIKPTVKGLNPLQETPDEVSELKPWARTVVTVWVLMVIPILLYFFSMMVLSVPRVVATGLDSLATQWDKVQSAMDDGKIAQASVGTIESLMIVLPAMGMFFSLFRIGKKTVSGFLEMTSERPILRTTLGLVGVSALAAAAFVLIPNGEYKPIQPDERWTVSDGVTAVSDFTTGRPSLTEGREDELGGAPTLSGSGEEFVPSDRTDNDPASGSTTQEEPAGSQSTEPAPSPTPSG